jgi:hypothetical protein
MKPELRHCRPQREVGLSVTAAVRAEAAAASRVASRAGAATVLPQEGMVTAREVAALMVAAEKR